MSTGKQQHRYLLGDRSDRHQLEYGGFFGDAGGDSAVERSPFFKGFGEVAKSFAKFLHKVTVIDQQLGI